MPELTPLIVSVLEAQADAQDATVQQPLLAVGEEGGDDGGAAAFAASTSCPGWQVKAAGALACRAHALEARRTSPLMLKILMLKTLIHIPPA